MKNDSFPVVPICIYGVFAFLTSGGLVYLGTALFPRYELIAQVAWGTMLAFPPVVAKYVVQRRRRQQASGDAS